jgi:hypothetical protein
MAVDQPPPRLLEGALVERAIQPDAELFEIGCGFRLIKGVEQQALLQRGQMLLPLPMFPTLSGECRPVRKTLQK